jgi:hypothetical protein
LDAAISSQRLERARASLGTCITGCQPSD